MKWPLLQLLRNGSLLGVLLLPPLFASSFDGLAWAQATKKEGRGTNSAPKTSGAQKGRSNNDEKGAGGASGGGSLSLFKQIDPAKYILGPGDALTVNLWGEYDSFEQQIVSAEGKISLPTIGELKVAGLTLEKAEALLKRSVEKYYRNVNSGLSLTTLRTFKVPVLGAVHMPGNYQATLDTRVSDLLALAGGALPGGSLRRIQVKQGGKLRVLCDLNAYLKRGVEEADPFLIEGDVVFVPPVSGAVIRVFDKAAFQGVSVDGDSPPAALPLEYELEEGQRFSTLVADLGGLNPAWDFFNVFVVRQKPDGQGTIKLKVDIQALLLEKDGAKDIVLQKGDHVFFNAEAQSPFLNGRGEIVGIETPYFDISPNGVR